MKAPRRKTRAAPRQKALPVPTASEAAFEHALEALRAGTDVEVTPPPPPSLPAPEAPAAATEVLDEIFAHRRDYLTREDKFSRIGEAERFFTKVVGVSFEGRQDIVAGLRGGEDVQLVRHPENPADPNAIAVRYGALQLGYLRKEIAKQLAPNIDAGDRYAAKVTDVTGGGEGRHVGVNLAVRRLRERPARLEAAGSRRSTESASHEVTAALIGEHPVRAAQAEVLERVRAGRSVLAVFGTGRGKSFCFQLPAAERALSQAGKTLVFYPLRALANDQHDALVRKLAPLGVRILRANGAIGEDERADLEEALESGEWDVLLATPEFAEYHREAFTRPVNRPSLVVVDEAHHVFDSHHRPAYGTLGELIAALGRPQVLALTATANDATFAHVRKALRIEHWVIDATIRENLRVIDARGRTDKQGYMREVLRGGDKAIVYCNSRPEATKIAESLRGSLGNVVAFYHGGMPSDKRLQVENLFRAGDVQVVAATSAFGEGIDLPDVRHVFLYHINFSHTEFNQEAGRAGRDGLPASIHLLYGEGDRRLNDYIISVGAPTIGKLRELYRGMKGLAGPDGLRMTYEDVARTLDLEMVKGDTVGAAVRIFEDAGLVAAGRDEDGRFVRFLEPAGKVDLTQTTRFAEGEAIRDAFERFCKLALEADAFDLETIINRPIYPDGVPLLR